MNELKEGLRVQRVLTRSGVEYTSSVCLMKISMHPSQGGLAPWVRIEGPGGVELVNCDSVESLALMPQASDE